MRFPKWLLIPLIPVLMALAADRLHIENRLSAVETFRGDVVNRLDRIEKKLDRMDSHAR